MAIRRSISNVLTRLSIVARLTVFGMVINATMGALLMVVGTQISRLYFALWLGTLEMLIDNSIIWGALMGALFGGTASLIFATGVGLMAPTWDSYRLAVSCLCRMSVVVFVGWLLGGCTQVVLAAVKPQIYERPFHGIPPVVATLLRYAWVDGSIWGMKLGLFLSPVLALVMFRRSWLRTHQAHRREDAGTVECDGSGGSGAEDREAEVSKVEIRE